jgi:hypothetical protein
MTRLGRQRKLCTELVCARREVLLHHRARFIMIALEHLKWCHALSHVISGMIKEGAQVYTRVHHCKTFHLNSRIGVRDRFPG